MTTRQQPGPLTPKQQRFVDEYVIDLNATAAYKRAGYIARAHAAETNAARLLSNAEVKQAIAERSASLLARYEVTASSVLRELARIAFADPRDVVSWSDTGVKVKPSDQLTEDEARSIAEITMEATPTGSRVKVKQADKLAALHRLAQHLRLLGDDGHGVNVNVVVPPAAVHDPRFVSIPTDALFQFMQQLQSQSPLPVTAAHSDNE